MNQQIPLKKPVKKFKKYTKIDRFQELQEVGESTKKKLEKYFGKIICVLQLKKIVLSKP